MILLLKLALAPALVVGSSLAGRRWGQPVAGTLVALPIVAGPILFITGLAQGSRFAAQAASAALLGLMSLALFVLVSAWASRSMNWRPMLLVAWASCLAADFGLARMTVHPAAAFLLALGSAWAASRLLPPHSPEPNRNPTTAAWHWWDLPGRAAATAVLVVTVTGAAGTLGPHATGVLAPFPIATSVLAAFVMAQQGSAATVELLRGIPQGLTGFAVFCALVAVLIQPFGVAAAFVLATAAALVTQLIWRHLVRRTRLNA